MEVAVAGAVSALVASSVVYPLDTVKTRIQAAVGTSKTVTAAEPTSIEVKAGAPTKAAVKKSSGGARKMFFLILKEQGVAGLYRGFGASMLNTFAMQFAYFYWYTIVRRTYIKRFSPLSKSLNTATELALGALAAAISQLFTIPVSVIATRQQTSIDDHSFIHTVQAIMHEDGITGFWRGLKPSLVLTVNPAITYGMFERLKAIALKPGQKMTPGKAFVLGALSKTMATVVTYPYIMAKTRLQAKYEDVEAEVDPSASADIVLPIKKKKKERYTGAVDCLRQVYNEKGIAGWYQGMQAQIVKAVLSQALLFGIKDALEAYIILAIVVAKNKVSLANLAKLTK